MNQESFYFYGTLESTDDEERDRFIKRLSACLRVNGWKLVDIDVYPFNSSIDDKGPHFEYGFKATACMEDLANVRHNLLTRRSMIDELETFLVNDDHIFFYEVPSYP